MKEEQRYWNPLIGGFFLGTLLFVSFIVAGQGLGASGAFARVTAQLAYLYDAAFAANSYAGHYLTHGSALANWTVVEVVGVFLGGFISAAMAGRIKQSIEKGENYPASKRLFWAFFGGFLIGPATRLARGCTSGQALDGAAAFSVGAWIFMIAAFGAGFLVAPLFRRQWSW